MAEPAPHLLAYCERAGDPGLWAEPLNAVTNLFFILFAWIGYQRLRDLPAKSFKQAGDIWALVVTIALIGLGSGLWHSWAAPGWTVMVDTIPIYLFINIYIFSLYRRLAGLRWLTCGLIWLGFTLASGFLQRALPMETLHGSLMYLPPLALMLLSGLYLKLTHKPHGMALMALGGLFLVSLTFRTLDQEVCSLIPIGTHFVWHVLNAILLYRLVVLLIDAGPRNSDVRLS